MNNVNNNVDDGNVPNEIAQNTDNSDIMRLLDIACRNTDGVDENVLDKEDDEEVSQGKL